MYFDMAGEIRSDFQHMSGFLRRFGCRFGGLGPLGDGRLSYPCYIAVWYMHTHETRFFNLECLRSQFSVTTVATKC